MRCLSLLRDPRASGISSFGIAFPDVVQEDLADRCCLLLGERWRGLTDSADVRGVAVHQMHRRRMLDYSFGNRLCVDLAGTFTE